MDLKATELRIGNYIYQGAKIPTRATAFTIMNLSDVSIIIVKPIPLTEKWLRDFGFKKRADDNSGYKEGYVFQNRKVVLKKIDGHFRLYLSDTEDDWFYTTSIHIYNVHQLQNLYFALTETELVFNRAVAKKV